MNGAESLKSPHVQSLLPEYEGQWRGDLGKYLMLHTRSDLHFLLLIEVGQKALHTVRGMKKQVGIVMDDVNQQVLSLGE